MLLFVIGVCFFEVINCDADIGTDLHCTDPDTGDLHPVNSTWPSKTFCGSYTCKVRKISLDDVMDKPNSTNDNAIEPTVIATKSDAEKQDIDVKLNSDGQLENKVDETVSTTQKENDRFLTESEIKSIVTFLHTVKKSDLDELLEVYNTAEDIYKEMETAASENIHVINKCTNAGQTTTALTQQASSLVPYLYNPNTYYNIQTKVQDDAASAQTTNNQIAQRIAVMTKQDTKKYPCASPTLPYSTIMQNPYAQNMGTALQTKTNVNGNNKPGCLNGIICQNPTPLYSSFLNKLTNNPVNSLQANNRYYQNLQLIPYPFAYQYNNTYPYQYIPMISNQQVISNGAQPHIGRAVISRTPSNQIYNHQNQLINQRTVNNEVKNQIPPWQTEPLSANVLNEIKANLVEKSKRLLQPLHKKVKLERIGKVLRLDDLIRNRRHTQLQSDTNYRYETVIEKIECPQDHEPGYFRMGDSTQAYPACCPQRIDS